MGTDTNEVVTDVDSNIGVCASSINDAAGEHTHFLPALVLSLMRAAVVLVKALLVNSVSNEAYKVNMIDQIRPRESFPWRNYVDWCVLDTAALDGPPNLTVLSMLDMGFPGALFPDVAEPRFAAKGHFKHAGTSESITDMLLPQTSSR